MSLRDGDLLDDRYSLTERLGQGGQGSVWRAFDKVQRQHRALKIIDLHDHDPEAVERARREAHLVKDARHPALVPCHKLFEIPADRLLVLVFDFVQAAPLAGVLNDARLTKPYRLAALRHIAGALAYLHGRHIVHRDLKPDNVLVTPSFWEDPASPSGVKLIDFGIAGPRRSGEGATISGGFGTPPYMAPELFAVAGIEAQRSPARDVYAFGVIGWELLRGGHPTGLPAAARHGAYHAMYVHFGHGREPWPPHAMDGRWGKVITACLALDAEMRPLDGEAILAMLDDPAAAAPVVEAAPLKDALPAAPVKEALPAAPEPMKRDTPAPVPVKEALPAAPEPMKRDTPAPVPVREALPAAPVPVRDAVPVIPVATVQEPPAPAPPKAISPEAPRAALPVAPAATVLEPPAPVPMAAKVALPEGPGEASPVAKKEPVQQATDPHFPPGAPGSEAASAARQPLLPQEPAAPGPPLRTEIAPGSSLPKAPPVERTTPMPAEAVAAPPARSAEPKPSPDSEPSSSDRGTDSGADSGADRAASTKQTGKSPVETAGRPAIAVALVLAAVLIGVAVWLQMDNLFGPSGRPTATASVAMLPPPVSAAPPTAAPSATASGFIICCPSGTTTCATGRPCSPKDCTRDIPESAEFTLRIISITEKPADVYDDKAKEQNLGKKGRYDKAKVCLGVRGRTPKEDLDCVPMTSIVSPGGARLKKLRVQGSDLRSRGFDLHITQKGRDDIDTSFPGQPFQTRALCSSVRMSDTKDSYVLGLFLDDAP